MGVPRNHLSILMGFSIINQPFWGSPDLGNPLVNIMISTLTDLQWLPLSPTCGFSTGSQPGLDENSTETISGPGSESNMGHLL